MFSTDFLERRPSAESTGDGEARCNVGTPLTSSLFQVDRSYPVLIGPFCKFITSFVLKYERINLHSKKGSSLLSTFFGDGAERSRAFVGAGFLGGLSLFQGAAISTRGRAAPKNFCEKHWKHTSRYQKLRLSHPISTKRQTHTHLHT